MDEKYTYRIEAEGHEAIDLLPYASGNQYLGTRLVCPQSALDDFHCAISRTQGEPGAWVKVELVRRHHKGNGRWADSIRRAFYYTNND